MKSLLNIKMSDPGTSYKATRFDWTGVFEKIEYKGVEYAGKWYDGDDPFRHDNLCGMSEEFMPVWLPDGRCLKPGVGILDVPEGEAGYDHFKLYDIIDGGKFNVSIKDGERVTRHTLDGLYDYVKTVRLTGRDSFAILHHFENKSTLRMSTFCYNHNFLTFGMDTVGEGRRFDFPAPLSGRWREDSTPVIRMESGSVFAAGTVNPGEKAFCFALTYEGCGDKGYTFRASQDALSVDIRCDAPMDYAVFWTNDRVACVEPYVKIDLAPGDSFEWAIAYIFR